jgi:hypothetical protein
MRQLFLTIIIISGFLGLGMAYADNNECNVNSFKLGVQTDDMSYNIQPWGNTSEVAVTAIQPPKGSLGMNTNIILEGSGLKNCLFLKESGSASLGMISGTDTSVTINLLYPAGPSADFRLLVVPQPKHFGTTGFKDITIKEVPKPV